MRHSAFAFVSLLLSLGACARSSPAPVSGDAGAPQSTASANRATPIAPVASGGVASTSVRDSWPPLDLAVSTTGTPYTEKNPVVVVARSGITLVGDSSSVTPLPPPGSWSAGVDAAYKRSGPKDLFLVPLAAGLARAKPSSNGTLAVAVDKAIPYRLFTEVLFTAGQQEYGAFRLIVQGREGVSAIGSIPPTMGPSSRMVPIDPALNLAVLLVNEGVVIKATGGSIRPGCDAIGAGITVPSIAGERDSVGLRACVTRLRQSNPAFAGETHATLIANANVVFSEVVAALDVLREAGFSDVAFGIAR